MRNVLSLHSKHNLAATATYDLPHLYMVSLVVLVNVHRLKRMGRRSAVLDNTVLLIHLLLFLLCRAFVTPVHAVLFAWPDINEVY